MSYTDTYLVEKLREILLRLYPTPVTNPVRYFDTLGPSESEVDPNSAIGITNGKGSEYSTPSFLNVQRNGITEKNGSFQTNSSDFIDDISDFNKFSESEPNITTILHQGPENFHNTRENKNKDDTALIKNLQEFIEVLKMSLNSDISSDGNTMSIPGPGGVTMSNADFSGFNLNLTLDDISDLNNMMDYENSSSVSFKHLAIIVSYFLIACVSIIGNLLVVQLVIRSRRLHTLTHALLANLAVADLFMATLNIPFSAARVILSEWPFGSFLCQAVPFVQVTSVYVTSITMAVIAIDRYQVIMNPLGHRMKNSQGVLLVFAIWTLSAVLSLPYALHHKVVTILTVRVVERCQSEFGSVRARRWLTVATFLAQYLIPLVFTTFSYVSIMMRLKKRSSGLGFTTPRQVAAQSRAKRKTIKMLVLTVIFFAVSWAPINIYHLLTHFSLVRHNSMAILICHLIAMSSSCYNPFIYCWLNEHFRREALKWLRCFRTRRSPVVHPGIEVNGMLTRADLLCRRNPSTTMVHTMSFRSHHPNQNQSFPLGNMTTNLNTNVNPPSTPPASSSRNAAYKPELLFLADSLPVLSDIEDEEDCEIEKDLESQNLQRGYVQLQIGDTQHPENRSSSSPQGFSESKNENVVNASFDCRISLNHVEIEPDRLCGFSNSENILLSSHLKSNFISDCSLNVSSKANVFSDGWNRGYGRRSASCGDQV